VQDDRRSPTTMSEGNHRGTGSPLPPLLARGQETQADAVPARREINAVSLPQLVGLSRSPNQGMSRVRPSELPLQELTVSPQAETFP